MKTIPLTQGRVAIVDDEDFERISKWRWHVQSSGYVARSVHRNSHGKRQMILMHREILSPSKDFDVDHANGDPLDNRRCNLRVATTSQNICNQRKRSDNTTGFKGVSWVKEKRKYRAEIMRSGVKRHLGYFETGHIAALAYNAAAKQLHGEFALLN